ncbi:MAG: hypothetical protein ACRC6E_08300 [Fusobacteriaceae bacterium]
MKSYSLSVCKVFLALYWDTYVIHNKYTDFVMLLVGPSEEQVGPFRSYCHDFIKTCVGAGIISDKKTESSELNLVVSTQNQEEIMISHLSGSKFSTIFLKLGTQKIEGKHSNICLCDEAKFLNTRDFRNSIVPATGVRKGVLLLLSSAHDRYSEFQRIVESNRKLDEEDHHEKNTKLIKSGSDDNMDFCFNGRRHFQQHWRKMIISNPDYALNVERNLEAVGGNEKDSSFLTQFNNVFLGTNQSTFFDLKALQKAQVFRRYDALSYINNTNWCIVAGVDFAITGDRSLMTVKAIPNGWGSNREAILLFLIILNPSKCKAVDSIHNQIPRVYNYIKMYNISAVVMDETGIGKSAPEMLREKIREENYTKIREQDVIGIEFKQKNRAEILEFYWSRLQSGLEVLPAFPKEWEDEDTLKKIYVNSDGKVDSNSCLIHFLYEHRRFGRTEIKDEKTGELRLEFRQSEGKFLHDDSIFSSSLCSYILNVNPTIYSLSDQPKAFKSNTAQRIVNRWKR